MRNEGIKTEIAQISVGTVRREDPWNLRHLLGLQEHTAVARIRSPCANKSFSPFHRLIDGKTKSVGRWSSLVPRAFTVTDRLPRVTELSLCGPFLKTKHV